MEVRTYISWGDSKGWAVADSDVPWRAVRAVYPKDKNYCVGCRYVGRHVIGGGDPRDGWGRGVGVPWRGVAS